MIQINAGTRLCADWWSKLSKPKQDAYIERHPRSKKARQAHDADDEQKQDVPVTDEDKSVQDKPKAADVPKSKRVRKQKPAPAPAARAKHTTGEAAHKAVKHDLDAMEVMGLKTYSADAGREVPYYKEINNDLRSGKPLGAAAAGITRNLDHTFASAKTTEPIEVYRGLDGAFAAQLEKGTTFKDDGFTSTTSSESRGKSFAGGKGAVLMKISVPAGSKAISLSDVSEYPEEQEILLNRGGTYKVTDVTTDANGVKTLHVEYS